MMAAREARELRNLSKRCAESEARTKLLKNLVTKGLGLKEVEDFVTRERSRYKGGGMKVQVLRKQDRKHREIVNKLMVEKVKDSNRESIYFRKQKTECLGRITRTLGKNSRELRQLKEEIKTLRISMPAFVG